MTQQPESSLVHAPPVPRAWLASRLRALRVFSFPASLLSVAAWRPLLAVARARRTVPDIDVRTVQYETLLLALVILGLVVFGPA